MSEGPPKLEYESKGDIEREPANWWVLTAAVAVVPVLLLATILFGVWGALLVIAVLGTFFFLRARKGV